MITDEQVADVMTKTLSRLKFEYFHDKLCVVRKYFPCKEAQLLYDKLSLQEGMMKIWTLFEKEEKFEDMDSPWKGRTGRRYEPSSDKGGEQVDDIDPPWKGGAMIRISLMME